MSRKNLIIAIVLMVALIAAGIIAPTVWRINKNRQKAAKETEAATETDLTETETDKKAKEETLEFLKFDKLTAFFSKGQIKDFKEQIPVYLEKKKLTGITSVTFLEDKTTYPSSTDTLLEFALSDDSTLLVTYSSPTGAFLFGKEKLQVGEDTKTYERQTDETLPDVSAEDVEKRQEGGFADTKDTKPEETPAASETQTEAPAVTETPTETPAAAEAPAEAGNAGTGAQPETPAKEEAAK